MLPPTGIVAMLQTSGENLASASANPRADPRLKPAAHEFEACLMKEFLEPLQHGDLFADDGDDAGGSDSALMSFGSEALGRAISERGGFGIADRILRDLEKPSAFRAAAG